MAKVRGPMFSITASGTMGDAIEFVRWIKSPFRVEKDRSGMAYVRGRVLPLVYWTKYEASIRGTWAAGVSTYHDENLLNAESRNSWASAASGTGMSGFNRYCQKFIENNPQREEPWNIPSPE